MFPEFGHVCLILALGLAGLQIVLFAIPKTVAHSPVFSARPLALGQAFFVLLAYMILTISFINNDFSLIYVAQHSNSTLPIYYKITAVWGAHEGSLLLWILWLCLWQIALVLAAKRWPDKFSNAVLAVMGGLTFGLLLLLLFTSNPFLRQILEAPLDGADLNPLLQDFGMIIHPPILYAGYVGTSVAFAFAIAGLLTKQLDQQWVRWLQPWVLMAWIFLTIGIALGSWWAYYELGWGGWWFWDPVENASFMPWLTSTALLHCLALARKKGQLLILALFLAIITFALSLLGTFLVRSGSISSVHAFASDPERGMFILQFLAITIGGALFLYAWRLPNMSLVKTEKIALNSSAALILANNLLLLVATACVLLGTLYPLIYEAISNNKISVGYPYFNAVFVPIMLVLCSVLIIGMSSKKIWYWLYLLSAAIASIFLILWFGAIKFNAALGLTVALGIIISSLLTWRQTKIPKIAMLLAHLGLAVTIIGISITPAYEIEKDVQLKVGEQINLAAYTLQFQALRSIDGPNYLGYQGQFVVKKNDKFITRIYPEKRLYLAQELPLTETAILPGLFQDIYIALGQQISAETWSARIYYKPFVRWIWLGAIIMALGGLCAALPRVIND